MSIGLVCAHYDQRHTGAAVRVVSRMLDRLPIAPRICLVANSPEVLEGLRSAALGFKADATAYEHDNDGMEFGAYQAGIDRLDVSSLDWLIVMNDALPVRQDVSRTYVDNLCRVLSRPVEHPVFAGQIEESRRSFILAGQRTHRWVTTNCFALNRRSLAALGGRLRDTALDGLIHESTEPDVFFDGRLDPILRAHIEHWLLSPRGTPETWYGSSPLTVENCTMLARKARSIVQEKRLAAVLEGESAEFVSTRDTRFVVDLSHRIQRRARQFLMGVPKLARGVEPLAPQRSKTDRTAS